MGILSTLVIFKLGKRAQRRSAAQAELLEAVREAREAYPQQSSPARDTVNRVMEEHRRERQRQRDEDPLRKIVDDAVARKRKQQ
jgi:hypothetical protein